MRSRRLKQRNFLTIGLVCFGFFSAGAYLLYSTFVFASTRDLLALEPLVIGAAQETAVVQLVGVQEPFHIAIPSIDVNVLVENVGLTSLGAMDVPRDPMRAGWYEIGPRPGEMGSAVIAGHVNWWNGQDGAFESLEDVNIGDEIIVQDVIGQSVTFVVREIRMFDASADATEIFVASDGDSHLNLITCSGPWDSSRGQYAERLVVFADKVQE